MYCIYCYVNEGIKESHFPRIYTLEIPVTLNGITKITSKDFKRFIERGHYNKSDAPERCVLAAVQNINKAFIVYS